MRDDRQRLLDIDEAISNIQRYTSRSRKSFEEDELVRTWVVHHILLIGEACTNLSEELKDKHPEYPWREIIGMRNILLHHYFGVDRDAVWAVVEKDLPALRRGVREMLERL